MSDRTDFYNRLNIPPHASESEIKRAYRRAVKRTHPDVNKRDGATRLFLDIQEAYKVLSDPELKKAYDEGRQPTEPSRVKTAVTYSRPTLYRIDEPQIIYALLHIITTQKQEENPELPINVAIVLDTSTSMEGRRLQLLKAATKEITRDLKEDDRFSIITFNDRANVLIPSYHERNPSQIEAKINSLIAEGGTEIFQGLEAGFYEIRKAITTNYVNHIILITDGHTYGDEGKCLNLAEKAASLDIGVSGLGIGSEWNDDFLDEITALSGGQSAYIEHPKEVKDFLEGTISNLKKSYSRNITLHINESSEVNVLSVFRLLPEALPLTQQPNIRLGTLKYDKPHQLLLELLVKPLPDNIETFLLADATLDVKRKNLSFNIPIPLSRPIVSQKDDMEPPPEMLYRAISRLTLYRLQERAKEDLKKGKPDVAYQRMINLASHLMSKGEDNLAKIAMEEADHIKSHHTFSPDGKKQIKYGTRRMMLPGNVPSEKL